MGIPRGSNATVETGVFCMRYDIKDRDCDRLIKRVETRLQLPPPPTGQEAGGEGGGGELGTLRSVPTYNRRLLVNFNVDAPDGRALQLLLYEGEQHDILQYASDFLQYYKMPLSSTNVIANEIVKRLPGKHLLHYYTHVYSILTTTYVCIYTTTVYIIRIYYTYKYIYSTYMYTYKYIFL